MQRTSPLAVQVRPPVDARFAPGQVLLGKYRLERELGRGGMGVVYAAHHLLLAQPVALKMMLPELARDADAVARFVNEGRAAARLQNEHVARVMDVALLEDGTPFLVLELLDGDDLAGVLKKGGPMPVARVVDYLLEAMEAIAEAHASGVVHRDLKPSNLFVAEKKGTTTIKVLDFGISKVKTSEPETEGVVTATNALLGSPSYMPPEQLRNARTIDGRADIWSLGVIAYELLAGERPYKEGNIVELFAAIQEREAPSVRALREGVPQALDEAILRCLRRVPAERWPSVARLAAAMAPFGTLAAQASLARIEAFDAPDVAPVVVVQTGGGRLTTRISVPDTDPEDMPSETMLAPGVSNVQESNSTKKPGAGAQAHGKTLWVAAVVVLVIGAIAGVVVRLARPKPPPDAAQPMVEATHEAPPPTSEPVATAAAPPAPPAAASSVSAPASAAASARPSPHRTAPAKTAPPASSAKPKPQTGVPSEWN